VATLADPPAKARRYMRPPTAAEARQLLEGIEGRRPGSLFTVAVATEMRQGELLGLRWGDVDLAGGTLTVRSTLRRGTQEVAEPKTERSRRMLHLGETALATLRAHRDRQRSGSAACRRMARSCSRPATGRRPTPAT
jgi:integrase